MASHYVIANYLFHILQLLTSVNSRDKRNRLLIHPHGYHHTGCSRSGCYIVYVPVQLRTIDSTGCLSQNACPPAAVHRKCSHCTGLQVRRHQHNRLLFLSVSFSIFFIPFFLSFFICLSFPLISLFLVPSLPSASSCLIPFPVTISTLRYFFHSPNSFSSFLLYLCLDNPASLQYRRISNITHHETDRSTRFHSLH